METFKKQLHTGHPMLGLVGISMTVLLGLAAGCTKESAAKSEPVRSTAAVGADSTSVVATVGDEKVTMADVRNRAGDQLAGMELSLLLFELLEYRSEIDIAGCLRIFAYGWRGRG